MSLSAAVIRELVAAGVTGDALVAACERIEAAERPQRSKGAERTARWRERNDERHGDVTSVTSDDMVSPLVPPLSPAPLSPPIIPPSIKTSRATDLPNDWEPDAKTWALADELGFTTQETWDQLDRMRDWARNAGGGKGRKSDWNAAFRNWIKRASDERRNKPQATRQRNSIQDSFAILDAVVDEAIRRSDGGGPEGSEEDSFEFPGLRKSAA